MVVLVGNLISEVLVGETSYLLSVLMILPNGLEHRLIAVLMVVVMGTQLLLLPLPISVLVVVLWKLGMVHRKGPLVPIFAGWREDT
jgi:hypothetical protein